MAKQSTRDAALSRLFGNTASEEPPPSQPPEPEERGHEGRVPPQGLSASTERAPGSETFETVVAGSKSEEGRRGARKPEAPSGAERSASGYIGMGRYARSDGVVERITPYVRPDQAEALRIAVARKNDPRGSDVSQIIQSLLDEAGYSG